MRRSNQIACAPPRHQRCTGVGEGRARQHRHSRLDLIGLDLAWLDLAWLGLARLDCVTLAQAPAKQDFDPIDPLGAEDTDMSSMLSGALTVKKDTGDWDTSKVTTTPGKGVLKALFPGLGSSRSSSSASTSRSTSPVPSSRRSRSFGLSSPRALVSSTLGGLGKARSKSSLDLESLPWHGHGIPLGTSLNSAPGDGWCPEARS